MIRMRGNTKHTQRAGWEPADITVEVSIESEQEYEPGTITQLTLRVHQELQEACDELNREVTATKATNPFAAVKPA